MLKVASIGIARAPFSFNQSLPRSRLGFCNCLRTHSTVTSQQYVSRISRALIDLTEHIRSSGCTAQEASDQASQLLRWVRLEHDKQKLSPRSSYRGTLRALERLKNGEPIAYVLGNAPFGNLTLECKSPVLIPRHETEEWTLRLGDLLKEHVVKSNASELSILDLCTGTG